jgi:hypothetical protein
MGAAENNSIIHMRSDQERLISGITFNRVEESEFYRRMSDPES